MALVVAGLPCACTSVTLTPNLLIDDPAEFEEEWDDEPTFAYEDSEEPPPPDGEVDHCSEQPTELLAADASGEPQAGQLLVEQEAGVWVGLPLQSTSFDTLVVGTVAETLVTQRFENTFDEPVEVVYVFPLPHDGAVDDYWLKVQDRRIRGEMMRRKDAVETYEKAKREGKAAGLLEQERPNVFSQKVANIPPGETIEVELHVVQPLTQYEDQYELALPTVVGPRYAFDHNPPTVGGQGAARRCGALDITVAIDAGMPVKRVATKSHAIDVARDGDEVLVELRHGDERLNRDFVLSWTMDGGDARGAMQVQPGDEGYSHFTLSLRPPEFESDEPAPPRELIFVVDTSGSMGGEPIETARAAMRRFLASMRSEDTFQIVRFSDESSGLGDVMLPGTSENLQRAEEFMEDLQSGGGTDMSAGIRAAFTLPHEPDRTRMVMFLTDGYIGNETEIFKLVGEEIGDAHLFSLGIGSSVNRYLLDGLADFGHGTATYVDNDESPAQVVERFYKQIRSPAITDIEIDWGKMKVSEFVPGEFGDLFHGEPLVGYGRIDGNVPTQVTVRGKVGTEAVEIPVAVTISKSVGQVDGIASMWARERIEELDHQRINEESGRVVERLEEDMIQLSLRYRVMTEMTAFVAVDGPPIVETEKRGYTVVQGVDQVEGVMYGTSAEGLGYLSGSSRNSTGTEGVAYGLSSVGTGRGGGGSGHGSIALGNTGTIGKGGGGGTGSGYGRGAGVGFGGRGRRVPKVRYANARVSGSLSSHIIRRIVRAHKSEIRGCYNRALIADPDAAGRVVLEFVISPRGRVSSAKIGETSDGVSDPELGRCIAAAAKRWRFPAPRSAGTAIVSYPFMLSTDDGHSTNDRDRPRVGRP
jgi:Ca-activated chloride channel family protein